jgi:rod shape-determining protein MreD
MSWARSLRTLIAFAILVSLHFTLRPLLGWRAAPDFLVIALLLASVRVRPGIAAFVGLGIGLLVDAMSPSSFGAAALAMATVGFVAAWLKAVFFADNLALNGFFFFLGKWVFDILYLVGERRVGGEELAMQLLLWSPLAAAVTAIAGVLLLVMMRPMLETSPT